MFFPYYFTPYDLLLIPGFLLGLYAQFKLSAAYAKYAEVGTRSNLSGAEAARQILDHAGLTEMPIEEIPGQLSDHFDPAKKALFLSSENFHGRSISAVGVAAHEAGHALQQKSGYALMNIRMALVPAASIGSHTWIWFFIAGLVLRGPMSMTLINIAIGIFTVVTLFQVVTLPVEFDASRRAKEQLLKLGLVQGEEGAGVAKVLSAAAMTYVAGMVSAFMQLLRLIMIANSRNRS